MGTFMSGVVGAGFMAVAVMMMRRRMLRRRDDYWKAKDDARVANVAAQFRRERDRGSSAVEYGLLVAAIAALIVGVVFVLGGVVRDQFSQVSSCIENSNPNVNACSQPAPPPNTGP